MNQYAIIGIGLLAQGLFSIRLFVQWIVSERARQVLSPALFWELSMAASVLLCLYGWLRNDFAIILGQLISYYIYIWNLQAKGSWGKLPKLAKGFLLMLPAAAIFYFLFDWNDTFNHLFEQEHLPLSLILFGVAGQFTFTLRFIFQWWSSRKVGESVLPSAFWVVSLTGSTMIIAYAIMRHDLVLILGQSGGFVVYIRNIMIGRQHSARIN